MVKIKSLHARELLDSRGNPTVEVDLFTKDGRFSAIVPSGLSRGIYEAFELRDNDKRYNGKGVLKAVKNINDFLSKKLVGIELSSQRDIDELMIKLDGTENKKNLGANTILAVSMAFCRAIAFSKKTPLYRYIAEISGTKKISIPVPSFNIINGGKHAGNKLAIQEFMILPTSTPNFREAMRYGVEVYQNLKKIIKKKYGQNATNVGDEGGFAPDLETPDEALDLITNSINISGYKNKIKIGIDVAASEFYENGKYNLGFKSKNKKEKTGDELLELYKNLIKKYPLISIEDPFDQNDWQSYQKLTSLLGKKIQIVGDDLLVTNPKRIREAIEKKACNTLLLKINQIGTVTESIEAFKIAKKAGWNVIVSHRSGETEDTFISDLAVGLGSNQIKAGAPCRSERLAKYNQLIRIEEELKRQNKK